MSEQRDISSESGGQRTGGDGATPRSTPSVPGSARSLGPVKTGKDTPREEISLPTSPVPLDDSVTVEMTKKEPLPPIGTPDKYSEMVAVPIHISPANSVKSGKGSMC